MGAPPCLETLGPPDPQGWLLGIIYLLTRPLSLGHLTASEVWGSQSASLHKCDGASHPLSPMLNFHTLEKSLSWEEKEESKDPKEPLWLSDHPVPLDIFLTGVGFLETAANAVAVWVGVDVHQLPLS